VAGEFVAGDLVGVGDGLAEFGFKDAHLRAVVAVREFLE
jgi:hypothetical protein